MGAAREVEVPAHGFSVTASVHGEGATAVILGHGAGGTRRTPLLVHLADSVAASGRCAVLYNFRYTDERRRIPDKPPVLEEATAAVGEYARASLGARHVVHGGKSMGGRIASQAVAGGMPASGLVFLGYPLHPPGKTGQLRDAHFPRVNVPMLFVQGTRDAFARWDLLETLLGSLGPRARLFRIDGGDHSFVVPKASGRGAAAVEADIAHALRAWLEDTGI
jgi:predicted alpha/beta-hydrolase family hydrolase